jgi:putative membrane protein
MRKASLFGYVSAFMVVALLTLAPGLTRAADNPQPLSPEEQAFLAQAMSDNAAQIAMATLALQKSKNPHVIDLANTVIQERTVLDAQLASLLGGAAKSTANSNAAATASLQSLNGEAFDKSFAGLLVRDHNRIISAYECIKASSTNSALRNLIHNAVPQLQGNLMVALTVLRSPNWTHSAHSQSTLSAADPHSGKTSPVFLGDSLSSIVTAPW